MARAKFERKKTHVNIGTIGHVDHGKVSIISALHAPIIVFNNIKLL